MAASGARVKGARGVLFFRFPFVITVCIVNTECCCIAGTGSIVFGR